MKKVIVATLLVVSLLSSACTAQPIVCRNVHEIVYDSRGNPYDVVRRDCDRNELVIIDRNRNNEVADALLFGAITGAVVGGVIITNRHRHMPRHHHGHYDRHDRHDQRRGKPHHR